MNQAKHPLIDSQYFEFRKMRAFLETGIYIEVPGIPLAPIDVPQQYVNSLLLIDLISILDKSVDYFFRELKLIPKRGISKFEQLSELGEIQSPQHFLWYKNLRNQSAHEFARHEWHFLNAATELISNQLEFWNINSATWNFSKYFERKESGKSYVGSKIDHQVILSYEVTENKVPVGISSSAGLHSNMNFTEFSALPGSWSRRVIYVRGS